MVDIGPKEVPHLRRITLEVLEQIPRGKVTSYKDVAVALGDPGAARAVGSVMANNPKPDEYPCWRVVHSDGRIGNYSGESGKEGKISRMEEEGIPVEDGVIRNFSRYRFRDFELEPPLEELRRIQAEIPGRISRDEVPTVRTIGGVDVSYGTEGVVASYVETSGPGGEVRRKETLRKPEVKFPYIPGYLAFRELPLLLELLDLARGKSGLADVIVVDGNGLLHPRRAGLASHLGVLLDHPTVGVAEKLLCGTVDDSEIEVGETKPVEEDGEELGAAVKTYGRANPIYVSIGNGVTLRRAAELVLESARYKLPEPQRQAHKLAKEKAT